MASFTDETVCDIDRIYTTVNPSFKVDVLIQRCLSDIDNFYKENNVNDKKSIETGLIDDSLKVLEQYFSIEDLTKNIEDLKQNIVNYIKSKTNISDLTNFDYLTHVSNLKDKNETYKFWILRTILFYLLLIHVTIQLQEDLNIKNELHNFHLGIFGSLTPTSDIDVGIRYVGEKHDLCSLSFIVKTVEDAFIDFIGVKNSLALDIEPYADMYILPNWGKTKNSDPEDMFFLNTFDFDECDFEEMLPYVYASIMRNYIKIPIVEKYIPKTKSGIFQNNILHLSSFKTPTEWAEMSEERRTDCASLMRNGVKIKIQENFKKDSQLIKFKNIIDINYEQSFKKGLDKAFTYMKMDYNEARQEYYRLVLQAEKDLLSTREQIYNYYKSKSVFKFELVLEKAQILKCMKAISETLIYRQESYVCTSTITHVVRILQSDKQISKPKYPTNKCVEMMQDKTIYTTPFCSIGKYGFLISAMEQYGYLLRFYKTYCIDPNDKYLCDKKQKKYNCRLNDAMESYNTLLKTENNVDNKTKKCENKKRKLPSQGGKRKNKTKTKRKHKRKRSTKKLR